MNQKKEPLWSMWVEFGPEPYRTCAVPTTMAAQRLQKVVVAWRGLGNPVANLFKLPQPI